MMTVDDMARHPAYREGGEAALKNRPRTDNPYIPDTESGWLWDEGWRAIERSCKAQPRRCA
jgi:hypothetical protein